MGLTYLLDTNAVLYFLQGVVEEDPPRAGEWAISIISEIELFGKPGLAPEQAKLLRSFLDQAPIVSLTHHIKDQAIELRQSFARKVPDAIIAATSLALELQLLSNDAKLLRIPGLKSRPLKLAQR